MSESDATPRVSSFADTTDGVGAVAGGVTTGNCNGSIFSESRTADVSGEISSVKDDNDFGSISTFITAAAGSHDLSSAVRGKDSSATQTSTTDAVFSLNTVPDGDSTSSFGTNKASVTSLPGDTDPTHLSSVNLTSSDNSTFSFETVSAGLELTLLTSQSVTDVTLAGSTISRPGLSTTTASIFPESTSAVAVATVLHGSVSNGSMTANGGTVDGSTLAIGGDRAAGDNKPGENGAATSDFRVMSNTTCTFVVLDAAMSSFCCAAS
jgi:hypothetical protein